MKIRRGSARIDYRAAAICGGGAGTNGSGIPKFELVTIKDFGGWAKAQQEHEFSTLTASDGPPLHMKLIQEPCASLPR